MAYKNESIKVSSRSTFTTVKMSDMIYKLSLHLFLKYISFCTWTGKKEPYLKIVSFLVQSVETYHQNLLEMSCSFSTEGLTD